MTRPVSLLAAALIALGGAAKSDGQSEPAPLMVPVPPQVIDRDWTGYYGGLQFGVFGGVMNGDTGDDGFIGAHLGFDRDFGNAVLGAEIDYIALGTRFDTRDRVGHIARLKLRAGINRGRTLIYATTGVARADTSDGDAEGLAAGIGFGHAITDDIMIGAELLGQRMTGLEDSALDLDAAALSLRTSFRF